jgi:hypothetical protein
VNRSKRFPEFNLDETRAWMVRQRPPLEFFDERGVARGPIFNL